jgi:hypothetical protein
VTFQRGDEVYSNVYHATLNDYSEADQQDLADAIDAIHTVAGMALFGDDITYVGTTVYDVRSVGGGIKFQNANTRVGGTSGDTMPLNVAVVVTHRTATRGRSGRGRTYVAGLPRGAWITTGFSSTLISDVENYVEAIRAAIVAEGWEFVIRSAQQNGVVLNPAVARPVTEVTIRNAEPGTQRRRVDRS